MTDVTELSEERIAEYLFELAEEDYGAVGRSLPIVDTSANTKKAAACLKKSGIETVIRYYARDPAACWKTLSRSEAESLIDEKIDLAIVHENDAKPSSFSYASGSLDAEYVCKYGLKTIGQPEGSAVYFAVDFDYLPSSSILKKRILPYFQGVRDGMKAQGSPYIVGVYGSGFTCQSLLDHSLVDLTWLAQSTGWTGYKQFKASKRWALLQHAETALCKIPVDYDEPNPSIPDFGSFDKLNAVRVREAEDESDDWEQLRASSALDGLDPDLKAKVLLLLKKCLSAGAKMVPYFGVRDPMTQAKLWRQSRTKAQAEAAAADLKKKGAPFLASVLMKAETEPGKHVTNALPGLSWHQWGEALDCYWEVNGKPEWNPDKKVNGVKGYHVYADTAETVGLTAGGHWTSLKDWPHVQLRSADGPQKTYSYPFIDQTMKDRFGELYDLEGDAAFSVESRAQGKLAEAFKGALEALRDASSTSSSGRPYFFPNGIFKIDVALGLLADPPPGADETSPGLSARITVSGIDKE